MFTNTLFHNKSMDLVTLRTRNLKKSKARRRVRRITFSLSIEYKSRENE